MEVLSSFKVDYKLGHISNQIGEDSYLHDMELYWVRSGVFSCLVYAINLSGLVIIQSQRLTLSFNSRKTGQLVK